MPFEPHPTDPNSVIYKLNKYWLPKPWVGLTREEIVEAYCSIHVKEWAIGGMDDVLPFTRAIEAKLKEKNT